jgi:hypothetical protein
LSLCSWLLVLSSWLSSLARNLKDGQQPAVRGQALACVTCRRRQKKYESRKVEESNGMSFVTPFPSCSSLR